jgi:transmembrane sensor
MSTSQYKSVSGVREAARDEAIEWFLRFCEDEASAADCSHFEAWLKLSPENVQAYLQISAFWEAAGSMNAVRRLDLGELARRALAESNIVALEMPAPSSSSARGVPVRPWLARTMAACLVLSLLFCAAAWWHFAGPAEYITQVGEERAITLPDQSVVQMNARSRIRVRFSKFERTLDLLEGQAFFQVARNPDRPFVVISGGTSVRAVGTQFDVDRRLSGTTVTVVEGRVAVAQVEEQGSDRGAPQPLLLSAGDQVTASAHVTPIPTKANPAIATAWTQGKLIFDGTPLAEVVHEFNRYSSLALSIDDPQLLSLHVTGTFSTSDSRQIVRFLSARFGLVVHESADGIRLSRP